MPCGTALTNLFTPSLIYREKSNFNIKKHEKVLKGKRQVFLGEWTRLGWRWTGSPGVPLDQGDSGKG